MNRKPMTVLLLVISVLVFCVLPVFACAAFLWLRTNSPYETPWQAMFGLHLAIPPFAAYAAYLHIEGVFVAMLAQRLIRAR